MANLIEDILWEEGIYQIETTDLVLGGEDGISNLQAKQLANRTSFLKDKLGIVTRFEDFLELSATGSVDNTVIGKDVIIDANNATIDISLAAVSSFRKGTIIPLHAIRVNKSSVAITANGAEKIKYGGTLYQSVYLEDMEYIWLIAHDTYWVLMPMDFDMKKVGEIIYSHSILPGTVPAWGQAINRRDLQRIWNFASGPDMTTSIVTEATWVSSLSKRGFYSSGNGSSTMRLPDLRGMFIRGLDSGRSLDLGRGDNVAGGYEADQNKSHSHSYRDRYHAESGGVSGAPNKELMPNNYNNKFGSGDSDTDNFYWLYYDSNTGSNGGLEAYPKNIGLIPLIRK